jgi:putative nucleotidyltransferase with HDIG domain
LIKFDQAIAANVLKMSNSAYLSPRHRISTVRDAVIYLGQQNLLKVVQTAGVLRFFTKAGRGYAATANELWEHSVAVALMSQILARKILKREDETLYLAALLHDVGKVVMGEFVHDSFALIIDLVSRHTHSFLEAEEAVTGINHADLGGRIAVRWNYPEKIQKALTYHHQPDLAGEDDMTTWLVYLADQICLMAGFTGGMDGLAHRGVNEVMKKFDFYQKDLEMGIMQLVSDVQHARELVHIA